LSVHPFPREGWPPRFGSAHLRGCFGPWVAAPSGFTLQSWRAGRTLPVFCRMAPSRCAFLLPTSIRSGLRRIAPPTMPSADFCAAVRPPCDNLSLESGTPRRPPEVRPTAFAARPPDLPPRSLMTLDFAITGSLVRPGRPRYPVLVHRAAALLHASFRPHLAMTPLRFANPSPPSGWIEDFHLQAVDHARHTNKKPGARPGLSCACVRAGAYAASSATTASSTSGSASASASSAGFTPRRGPLASAASISFTASVSVTRCTAAISRDSRSSAAS
jgi:hypothetical protein